MRAFQTLASVTPVTVRPLDFWYSLTRASVARAVGAVDDSLPMAPCRALTAAPVDPQLEHDVDVLRERGAARGRDEPERDHLRPRRVVELLASRPRRAWLCHDAERGGRDRPEPAVGGDADDLLGQDDVGTGGALHEERVAARGDRRGRRRGRVVSGPVSGVGHGDAAPPRGPHAGAVPVEREVDVVGVRRDAVVRGPAAARVVGPPLLAVPDDVVDAEAAWPSRRAGPCVGCGEPAGERVRRAPAGPGRWR